MSWPSIERRLTELLRALWLEGAYQRYGRFEWVQMLDVFVLEPWRGRAHRVLFAVRALSRGPVDDAGFCRALDDHLPPEALTDDFRVAVAIVEHHHHKHDPEAVGNRWVCSQCRADLGWTGQPPKGLG